MASTDQIADVLRSGRRFDSGRLHQHRESFRADVFDPDYWSEVERELRLRASTRPDVWAPTSPAGSARCEAGECDHLEDYHGRPKAFGALTSEILGGDGPFPPDDPNEITRED